MTLPTTALATAVFGLLLVAFALPVMALRAKHEIPFGDGDRAPLQRAIRAHANFVEYAPLMLLLVAALELGGASPARLWSLLGAFLAGRAAYAVYFYLRQALALRIVGFWATVLPLVVAAVMLLL